MMFYCSVAICFKWSFTKVSQKSQNYKIFVLVLRDLVDFLNYDFFSLP